MTINRDQMAARIFLRAVLPVMKVMLAEDPKRKAQFANVSARVAFTAAGDGDEPVQAWVGFNQGAFSIGFDACENPDITFGFDNLAKMNALR